MSDEDGQEPSTAVPSSDLAGTGDRFDIGRLRIAELFDQIPGFTAVLSGPDHRIDRANPAYLQLVGDREILGRTVAEALPDAVDQGYLGLLDRVFASGEAFTASDALYAVQPHPGGPSEDRYIDFVYQPIRGQDAQVAGIFVHGTDVTQRVHARRRRDALVELTDRFRGADGIGDLSFAAGCIIGEALKASRVGFGTIDPDHDTLHVERDWTADGVETLRGVTALRRYGSFVEAVKQGRIIRIADVREDERTASAASAFEARSARSLVNVPVLEGGRVVALLFVNSDRVRVWTDEEVSFIREVAERTRTTVERARTEAALRESEARLADEAAALARLNALSSRLWRVRGLTEGLEEMLGATIDLLGADKGAIQLLDPRHGRLRIAAQRGFAGEFLKVFADVSAEHASAGGRSLRAGERTVIEDVRADPDYAPFHDVAGRAGYRAIQATPLIGRDGSLLGMLSTHWANPHRPTELDLRRLDLYARQAADFIERSTLDIALRESEAQFRLMADAVPQIVWITDAEGRATFFNRQWSTYTGVPYEPATAAEVAAAFVHPDDAEATMTAFDDARRTGATFLVEHRIRSAAGEYRWFLVRGEPYYDPRTGAITRWFGASVDIHDRREAEAGLRRLNETLEAQVAERSAERDRLWNLSQDMLARADYSGMMSAVSPAWTQVLGWSETELLTRGYATFMHPEDMPPTIAAIGVMAETRQPARFENRIATRDGGWKNIEWTVAPEPDGQNFIAIGRDVSVTRAREAELAAAQEQLRQSQKMEAMGQLTGGVAHDFNNLLTPIVGALDMLERRGVGGEREKRLISGAAQSAERAKTLVQRLLAFARRQPLRPVAVDVGKLIEGMVGLVSSTTGPQIRVVVDAAHDLPPAKADPNQLEMALLNLSVNARDAMPEGGTLRISASAEAAHHGAPSALRPGSYVRVAVADTGLGMDEETLARAIEPFFSTKGVGKGTGLGLSMVHGLASQLGGALTIQSRPGLGTTVELWLPQTEAAPEVRLPVPEAELTRRRGTALLVDDEEFVRVSTADMLGDLGYHVLEAASAEEALHLIGRGADLDLVVTDHLMPGMTGADLARAVRERRPELPVLLVSGYAEVEGIAADLPRLTKPFRKDELAVSLAGLSAARAAQQPLSG